MTTTIAELKLQEKQKSERLGNSDWPQENVERTVRPAPDRYRNAIGKFKVDRLASCIACGRCAEVCAYGVHVKPEGYKFTVRPLDYRCIGPDCLETGRTA